MLNWLISPRRAAKQWVAEIVRQELAPRDLEDQRLRDQTVQAFHALALSTIRPPDGDGQGSDARKSTPE